MDKVKCSFCDGKGYIEVYNNSADRVIVEVDCPECSEDEDEENEYV